jgi:hypothetical protein
MTTFEYGRDRVLYSRDVGGLHFVFLQVWPDSAGRAWMERDLGTVSNTTPVVLFVHDQPDAEAKHFINPNGARDVNPRDQFENLLSDVFADGTTIDAPTAIHVFRVDSPMKGHESADDERRLSFHVATIDTSSRRMTVRECLWSQGTGVAWGLTATVALGVPLPQP